MPYILNGANVSDLDSFWTEIARTVLADTAWQRTLPGFDVALGSRADVLRGATVRWIRAHDSRRSLGHEATLLWLEEQARFLTPENAELAAREIGRAKRGQGPTLFDMLIEAMRRHGLIVELAQS